MASRASNFSKMDLAELLQLRDELETALNGKIAMERRELELKMAELAALETKRSSTVKSPLNKPKTRVRGSKSPGKRKPHPSKGKKAKPLYKGPNGETWAGRGLAPRWLTDLEKNGKKRDQFLIKK